MWRNSTLGSLFTGAFYSLPSPINLSYWWNFSSLLGLVLVMQILSGLFLTMHYSSNIMVAFDSVSSKIGRDVSGGWVFRYVHANGASLFLFLLYLHLGRSLYYKRYFNTSTWLVGVILMLLTMLTAFLGYVLPWGQMSFWGATVITNLITAIPVWSTPIVYWIWGSFSVENATLNRFYTFHFLIPFVVGAFSLLHLVALHEGGSGNPVGMFSNSLKAPFWPYFSVKDIMGVIVALGSFLMLVFYFPDSLGDPDNFHEANPMITPVHIKPEWYFLFAYAILRCIPNKGMGVMALVGSIIVFSALPLGLKGFSPSILYQLVFWLWVGNFIMLTWLGGCPVKDVFTFMSQVGGFLYFALLGLLMFL